MTSAGPLFGAIEGGGTRFNCAVGRSPTELLEVVTLPTTQPEATLGACIDFFTGAVRRHGPLAAVGFGCFGPLELRVDSPGHGRLLPTPKAGWSGADVVGPLRTALGVEVRLDTDVAAAALGEWRLGAGRDAGSLAYVTVGTGIGGAVVPRASGGRWLMHAEMGHIPMRRDPRDRDFAGRCPFHRDCLEGLASGPAITARWGSRLQELDPAHEGRSIIAGYLGQLCASLAFTHSVERVVLGGGVMSDGTLLPAVREAAFRELAGYLPPLASREAVAGWIVAPALGERSTLAGAVLLAAGDR